MYFQKYTHTHISTYANTYTNTPCLDPEALHTCKAPFFQTQYIHCTHYNENGSQDPQPTVALDP